jgi:excinuclease UvrABC helicase subunit UvrB
MKFKLVSNFKPKGSQPEAIKQFCEGLQKERSAQTLLVLKKGDNRKISFDFKSDLVRLGKPDI